MKKIYSTLFCFMFVAGIAFTEFANSQTTSTYEPPRGPSGMVRCSTPPPPPEWDAWFNSQVDLFKKELENKNAMITNYTIPVVVHIIHGGQAVGTYPNLVAAQINSQITVLNQDYSGQGYQTNTYNASAFVGFASAAANGVAAASKDASGRIAIANTGIQFCMATKDKNGVTMPEPGIDRVDWHTISGATDPALASSAASLQTLIDTKIKPGTIWDPAKYLNMWVTDELQGASGPGLLGYATFPAGATLTGISSTGTATTDGFWAYTHAFGSILIYPSGTYDATYKYGRTCTHEIGHYLGLRHTWGDGGSQCSADDYCNDTPVQKGGTSSPAGCDYGCPTYPSQAGSCTYSGKTNTNGDMFMNFMDYTDDACMYMFTTDQTTRIQTAMTSGTYRKGLNASAAALCTTGIIDNALSDNISLYPNPSTGDLFMNVNLPNISSADVTIFNAIGDIVLQKRIGVSTNNEVKFDMNSRPDGVYIFQMKTFQGTITKKVVINR